MGQSLNFSRSGLKELFSFSRKLLLSQSLITGNEVRRSRSRASLLHLLLNLLSLELKFFSVILEARSGS